MRRPSSAVWLTIASLASVAGGVVWLVWLVGSDARRAAMRVDPGETVTVEYDLDDPHEFSPEERATIADSARRAVPDVRRALPEAPASIVLRVRSAPPDKVAPETGDAADSILPNIVAWRVDTKWREGVVAIARAQLRPLLFHELHHLVRLDEIAEFTMHEAVVCEGLATAFERDYGWGGVAPPWGQYPSDVEVLAREVLTLPKDAPRRAWMLRHPDGRRWIGYKVGTFIADCAARSSGKTSRELARVPADTLIAMCPAVAGLREGDASGPPSHLDAAVP